MVAKTADMLAVEQRYNEPLETLIPRLYSELRSTTRVAKELGINRYTLYIWRRTLGIETRMVVTGQKSA